MLFHKLLVQVHQQWLHTIHTYIHSTDDEELRKTDRQTNIDNLCDMDPSLPVVSAYGT